MQQGIKPGDRIAVQIPKSIEEVIVMFAIAQAGGVIVNLFYQSTYEQSQYYLQDCNVKILFTEARKFQPWLDNALSWPADLQAVVQGNVRPSGADGMILMEQWAATG